MPMDILFQSSDTSTRRVLEMIEELPAFSIEREEAMAFLFMTLARGCWRRVDRIREAERARDRRAQAKAARAAPKESP